MTRKPHPDYHKAMLDAATHPAATRKVKHLETRASHQYKTGVEVFKIRKPSAVYASLAIKEVYAQESLELGRRWAPSAYLGVVPITEQAGRFALGGAGTPVDYALRMAQLSDHHFADYLARHGKLNATALGRVARFLAQKHAELPAGEAQAAEIGRPEYFAGLVEEVLYQSKKYFGVGLNEAMYELIARPMAHFQEHQRKTLVRRQKKSRVIHVHGAFYPEHVHVKQQAVEAISPLEAPRKLRVLDAASDVAQFCNGLRLLNLPEEEGAGLFLKRYTAAAKDRELEEVAPGWGVYHAVREGVLACEWLAGLAPDDERREGAKEQAQRQFNLAVDLARQLPK